MVTIQRSESTRQLIATRVREKPPKHFQVLEFIGHQEMTSGCSLMGLGGWPQEVPDLVKLYTRN